MIPKSTPKNLKSYLAAWNLTHPQPLATTPTSHVYLVQAMGAQAVLKLLTPMGQQDERGGALALRWFDGHGAVRLLRADDGAHLLEYAPGADLTGLVRRGDDDQATAIIGEVLNQLHRMGAGCPPGLTPLRMWFRGLFTQAEQERTLGETSLYVRAAHVAGALLADPQDLVVLHGDIHHENIRYRDGRGWLALDPKGLYGERTFDAANTLCNPLGMPEIVENEARLLRQAGLLAAGLNIPRGRVLAYTFAYAALSASWFLADGQDPTRALHIAALAEPHITHF